MSSQLPNEYTKVELPLIRQLQKMGWTWLNDQDGDIYVPRLTGRESFRQVLLTERLRQAIYRLNLADNDQPWLDETRLNEAVSTLERLGTAQLMEANQLATRLLINGLSVAGDPDLHGGREQTIHYLDFDHPERNNFLLINQFRVDPPGIIGNKGFIVPDIVLFVNGIPLVVIECKDTDITNPMEAGISDLLSYLKTAERLFYYNQFIVSTYYYEAKAGTISARPQDFKGWKDTSPVPVAQVWTELGVNTLENQHLLVAGMLRPAHLLDILRHFTLFEPDGNRMVKIIPRYQQFRAVYRTLQQLQTGQTKAQHGEHDQRGGIIWHNQGSGKSKTMVFLVRKMRSLPKLRRFKVVIVTDRRNLERQLRETAMLIGENIRPNQEDRRLNESASARLQRILREDSPDLVFAMIQKYQLRQQAGETDPEDETQADAEALSEQELNFPILNESEEILLLVDEAHRSHTSGLHANLMGALPHAAKVGVTGTPILVANKKRTHEIFGPYLDKYTIRESEPDGMTVPILYEGHEVSGRVGEDQTLNQLFETMFQDYTPKQREAIKTRYATQPNVLGAKEMINLKAYDLLRHYVSTVLPDGFKTQVVATSRAAAVRYQAALVEAHKTLLTQLENLDPHLTALTDEVLTLYHDAETRFLVRAYRHLDTIRRLQFAAVISASASKDPDKQDPSDWAQWSDLDRVNQNTDNFKRPLVDPDPTQQHGLAFLCVKSMLLVGFDAPLEQVIYLDRPMEGAELFQAVSRVNRTAPGKTHGLVVDYVGIGGKLKEALKLYTADEVEGSYTSIKDELPNLAARHRRLLVIFQKHGVNDIYAGMDDCVHLLRDEKIRADFVVKLRHFLESLNTVLPRPEGLAYVRDAKMLGIISRSAANRYRDDQVDMSGVGGKVQQLIDDHIRAEAVELTIPPISILDSNFLVGVQTRVSDRAKASEMEHAARHHISQHFQEDPVYYRKLSERLEEILRRFEDNWENQVELLSALIEDIQKEATAEDVPFVDKRVPKPFLRILIEEVSTDESLSQAQLEKLAGVTVELVDHIRQEIGMVDFWRNAVAQRTLRGWLTRFLDDQDLIPDFNRIEKIADDLMAVAKANHTMLTA